MTDLTRVTQEMIALYDRFTHEGGMSRRDLMAKMSRLAGSAAAAAAIVPLIEASAQAAAPPGTDNNQILAKRVVYSDGVNERMVGWLAHPERGQKRMPRVLVIHENRGLNRPYQGRHHAAGRCRLCGAGAGFPVAAGRHADRPATAPRPPMTWPANARRRSTASGDARCEDEPGVAGRA